MKIHIDGKKALEHCDTHYAVFVDGEVKLIKATPEAHAIWMRKLSETLRK